MEESVKDTYWDESEFGFFETLEDEDKLLYLYDLMIGEFAYIDIHNDSIALEEEEAELDALLEDAIRGMGDLNEADNTDSFSEQFETDKNKVYVSFLTEDGKEKIQVKGPELDVLLKVVSDMRMNGMVLMNRKLDFDKYEPWGIVITYDLIGNGPPISLN